MATPASINNYTIGKGKLYIANWTLAGGAGAYSEMGNCPSIEVEPSVDRLEHFSSREGLRERDAYPVVQTQYTITFECDEMASTNLTKYLLGTQSGDSIYILQNAEKEYALKFEATNPIGVKYRWFFHRVALTPNGAIALIGDNEWQSMSFTGEGLADSTNQASSPYATVNRITTTTTSSTSTTTSSTTTTAA